MRKKMYTAVALLAACLLTIGQQSALAQTPDFAWATQIGGSDAEVAYGLSTDAAGNVYTQGRFDSKLTLGTTTLTPTGTSYDAFITNLSSINKLPEKVALNCQ